VTNLRSLSLRSNQINAAGVRAIAASPNLERLERLDLSMNLRTGGESGAAALFTLDRLTSLQDLDLTNANITDQALERLTAGPLAGRLRRLSLGRNPIMARGVNTLATASTLRGLESLYLESYQREPGGLTPLIQSTTLEGLLWLSIAPATTSESDLLALAEGRGLPRLVFLMLAGEQVDHISTRSWQALRESPRRRNAFFVGLPGLGDHLELGDLQSPFLVGHEYL
jgi:Leucine-rich repeat (LRR) protein